MAARPEMERFEVTFYIKCRVEQKMSTPEKITIILRDEKHTVQEYSKMIITLQKVLRVESRSDLIRKLIRDAVKRIIEIKESKRNTERLQSYKQLLNKTDDENTRNLIKRRIDNIVDQEEFL